MARNHNTENTMSNATNDVTYLVIPCFTCGNPDCDAPDTVTISEAEARDHHPADVHRDDEGRPFLYVNCYGVVE